MIRAVKPPSFAQEHLQAMFIAGQIGETLRDMYWPEATVIKPEAVIRILKKAKVRFVLMGTYGINGYRYQTRATQDVDVLVRAEDHEKAVAALRVGFPRLKLEDFPVVSRFIDPKTKKPLIDVMKPNNESLQAAFKYSVMVGKSHLIPDLEMGLVSKFAAMVSPNRILSKKLQDGADFADIVVNNQSKIDLKKLRRLGEKVYKGGGPEIIQLVDDIKAGRPLRF
jgi:hypothetical protein